jgi:hypothetical protein
MIAGQTYPTITKCKMVECSVVDIPANENSICLFNDKGEKINLHSSEALEQLKLSFIKTKPEMKVKLNKTLTSLSAFLGLKFGADEQEKEIELTNEQLEGFNTQFAELARVQTENADLAAKLSAKETEFVSLKAVSDKATADLAAKTTEFETLQDTLNAQPKPVPGGNDNGGKKPASWVDPEAAHNKLKAEIDAIA